jgi:hypothetical protein
MHQKTLFGIFAYHVEKHYGVELIAFNADCILAKDETGLAYFIYYSDTDYYRILPLMQHHLQQVPERQKAAFKVLIKTNNIILSPIDETKQTIITL